MRWSGQLIDAEDSSALPGMGTAGFVRSVRTPDFDGITLHEVLCKSALNRVPGASGMPFRWTINPFRGCAHGCRYCFARNTHTYLDLDPGADFDSQIVVKTNVAQVLRRELVRPSWRQEPVALGTNTDPYQRAEGRYRLMPGIIEALVDARTPLSILTKGTLLRRDLPLLTAAASSVPVGVAVSLALLQQDLAADLEPGTPLPRARLELIAAIRDAGLPCGVLIAPVLPYLTDSVEQLDALLGELLRVGATSATILPLHLRPGTREWFMRWLAGAHPGLVGAYRALYSRGAYVPAEYSDALARRTRPLLDGYGFSAATMRVPERSRPPTGSVPDHDTEGRCPRPLTLF